MTDWTNTRAVRLARADRDAKANFEKEDLSSPMGACPARQAELFIVPTRYALAEQAAEHECFQPACKATSHPLALRRLRPGYLYLWHDQGPLKRYAVAADGQLLEQGLDDPASSVEKGALAGIALEKRHDAWLLYTEVPLTTAVHQRLTAEESERRARMRRIGLTQVAQTLEATHCPPLDSAEQLLAELMPQVRDQALAHDYAVNGEQHRQDVEALGKRASANPTRENVDAYTHTAIWLREGEDAAARHPEVAEHPPGHWSAVAWDVPSTDAWLTQARTQAGALYGVFASLDDDLGVLRDLNHEQEQVSIREEGWDQQHAHKGLMAGFINSLINEDGAELAGLLNYRYRDRDIPLTPEQGDTLLRAQHELKPLLDEETRINRERGRAYGHGQADAKLAVVHARVEQCVAPVRGFIPADLHGEVQGVVMAYRAQKARNMTDSKSGAQVGERVDMGALQSWQTYTAEPHRQWLVERRKTIHTDSKTFLARHGAALWYADYDLPEHCDWLSELALSSLSGLCSTGPGTRLAMDMLRSPEPDKPFSLLASGFTPELHDLGDRINEVEAALTSDNTSAVQQLLTGLVKAAKLDWLSGLSGMEGNDWGHAVSRLSAAFIGLQEGHLTGMAGLAPTLTQNFPKPLIAMLLLVRQADGTFVRAVGGVFEFVGGHGQRLWQWGQQAGQELGKGLAPAVQTIKGVQQMGGVLPLSALLLHSVNVLGLRERDANRSLDGVRFAEHATAYLDTGAALMAVTQNVWTAAGVIELRVGSKPLNFSLKAPTVTLFGTFVGGLAGLADAADLVKLAFEQQKDDAYWNADSWVRLGKNSATSSLMFAQAGMGGFATWQVLTGRWTTEKAIEWFGLRMVPVNWLILLIEGLYLAYQYFKPTELQLFLSHCCWGKERRWQDTPEEQSKELQALIDLLFKPRLSVKTRLTSKPIGPVERHDDNWFKGGSGRERIACEAEALEIILPGASPQSQVGFCLAAMRSPRAGGDITAHWLQNLRSQWLPVRNGQGLILDGKLPPVAGVEHYQLRVLYYSPLAMLAGTLNPKQLTVGGQYGVRFLIDANGQLTEHEENDGPLYSDSIHSRLLTPAQLLPRQDETI